MAVNVYQTTDTVAAQFATGLKIRVDNGYLRVTDGSGTIALFAPGTWHHAEVTRTRSAR